MTAPRSKRIRVLLVDDHPVVREGLREILADFQNLQVIGESSGGREAVTHAHDLRPDVILMDISMPDMTGIEATATLSRDLPECKVLALSMHDNRAYITQALRAGARGYILKDSAPRDLARAIADVHRGDPAMSPQAATTLISNAFHSRGKPELTAREIEVLRRVARGETSKVIAADLGLSVRTIETHRENLMKKVGATTAAHLTQYAVLNGYFTVTGKSNQPL